MVLVKNVRNLGKKMIFKGDKRGFKEEYNEQRFMDGY